MKKIYLLVILSVATSLMNAQDIVARWANAFEAGPPTHGNEMVVDGNNIYYLLSSGTSQGAGDSGFPKEFSDPSLAVYYGGEKICTGAPYEGASYNSSNLNIVKTDDQGNFRWVVYTTSGEFSSNDGGIVVAPDGGVVVAVKVRHTLNMRTSDILFTDATGKTTTYEWKLADENASRYFKGMLLKISAQGELQWIRPIDVSTVAQPAATGDYIRGTFDAISIEKMLVDGEGNCYVAGRYANPITFYDAAGNGTTLTPHNTEGWNGDIQNTRGDLMVAKFDARGYFVKAFTTSGKTGSESCTKIAWNGSNIVLSSFVKGNQNGDNITVAGNTFATPVSHHGLLVASLNSDLEAQWAVYYPGALTNLNAVSTMQWNDLQVAGKSIIVNGMGNFTLTDGRGNTLLATQNKSREGFVIKLDAQNGAWQAATTSMMAFPTMSPRGVQVANTGINGWLRCFEAQNDSLYVYGYNQSQQSVYLASLSSDDLKPGSVRHLILGGSMPIAISCVARDNMLYTMSRGRVYEDYDDDGNVNGYYQDFEYLGSDLKTTPIKKNAAGYFSSFVVPLAAFELPFRVREEQTSVAGDVNGDNIVNTADVTAIYSYIIGGDETYLDTLDVNGDGAVNAGDVTTIYNIILGN